jgi:ribokinase
MTTAPSLVCFGNLTLDDIVQPDGAEYARCIGGDALYGVLAGRNGSARRG